MTNYVTGVNINTLKFSALPKLSNNRSRISMDFVSHIYGMTWLFSYARIIDYYVTSIFWYMFFNLMFIISLYLTVSFSIDKELKNKDKHIFHVLQGEVEVRRI